MVQIANKKRNSKFSQNVGRLIILLSFTLLYLNFGRAQPAGSQPDRKLRGSSSSTVLVAAISASSILNSGKAYLIYGTAWKKGETKRLVSEAVHAGFRFIDTACQPKHYNEAGVGDGWVDAAKDMGLRREDLFLQTKYTSWGGQDPNDVPFDKDDSIEEQVRRSLDVSLRNLKTTYVDSLVMHSPFHEMEDTLTAWRVMESFVDDGKVRQLGISNCYNFEVFTQLYEEARIKPAVLQNRFYQDSQFDVELREFCAKVGVRYQSFWTLTASRKALNSQQIKEIASSKNLTPQTVMYAFMLTLGHTPLSGTTNAVHMAEDVAIMERIQGGEVIFDEVEMQAIAAILGIPER